MPQCPFCSTEKKSFGEFGAEFCGSRSRCPKCRAWSDADLTVSPNAVLAVDPVVTPAAYPGCPLAPGEIRK